MLSEERRKKLLSLLNENGSATVEELAKTFGVSEMTIRRDLEKCEQFGRVKRCHGGVMLQNENMGEVEYREKLAANFEAKKRIAAYCGNLVEEGMQIYLDAGTTALCIAQELLPIPGITVVTIDLEVALLLARHKKDVLIAGGRVQPSTGSTTDPVTLSMAQELHTDLAFFGAACINDAFDVLTPTLEKAFIKRAVQKNAKESILAVDASKFHRSALVRINNLADYTATVTDAQFDAEQQRLLRQHKIEIIHV